MSLLLGVLICGLAAEQPGLQPPRSAEESPRRILTSPDPDHPTPPKILTAPTGPAQWPPAESPAGKTSKTAPAAEPWLERQPAAPRQPATSAAPPAGDAQPSTGATSTTRLVAECFYVPPKELLAGRPVTLLEAVSRSSDRQQQLQIVRAYWRTARATADLCLWANYKQMLEQLRVDPADALLLEAAKASAAAEVSQAKVAAIAAQHELAGLMRLPVEGPLPLAADVPHAGDYRTYFAEIHATRPASEAARRANATIPLRRQAMQHQAAALDATTRLLAPMLVEIPMVGRPPGAEVIIPSKEWLHRGQAFIEAVVLYNLDIAEYAVAVAGPETTPQVLVNMLIRSRTTGPSARNETGPSVQPAQYQQDIVPSGNIEAIPPGAAQPSGTIGKAPRWGTGADEEPKALLPPRSPAQSPDGTDDFQPPRMLRTPQAAPLNERTPTQTAPSGTDKPGPITAPLVPVEPAAHFQSAPAETTVRRPLLPLAPMLYSALQSAAPISRAKQLAISLHSLWALPERTGRPLTLQQALSAAPPGRRRAVLEAYWNARQKAAEYQVFLQQLQWLEEYADRMAGDAPAVTRGATERLTSAKEQAQANLRRSHAELLEAQHKLASLVPSLATGMLPLPTTTPHAVGYNLRLEMQPPELTRSRPVIRLAALVPALGEAVCKKADSVVAADAARAKAAENLRAGGGSLPELIDLTEQQTAQTLDFLQTLTEYNLAIADYALAVMPADIPAQTLTASLVSQP